MPRRTFTLDGLRFSRVADAAPTTPSARPTGGAYSSLSGLGTDADKSDAVVFRHARPYSREEMLAIYDTSWAAAKIVDIPIDDVFSRGRQWQTDDEDQSKSIDQAMREHEAERRYAFAARLGRLHGTGVICMMTTENGLTEDSLAEPLEMDRISEGMLSNLLVVDRHSMAVETRVVDRFDPKYGMPDIYRVSLRHQDSPEFFIHESRVIRFDGRARLTPDAFSVSTGDWGQSVLINAINAIGHEEAGAGATAHLLQEASMMWVKIQAYQEAARGNIPGVMSFEDRARTISRDKSVWATGFLAIDEEVERLQVQFPGMTDLLNHQMERLAAITGIPVTRFNSTSPKGMDATGESDMVNYTILIKSLQENDFRPTIRPADQVILRSAGIDPEVDYEWLPLTELSDEKQAEVSKLRAEALGLVYDRNSLTEDEYREHLNSDPLFEGLGPLPDDFEPVDAQMMQQQADLDMRNAQAQTQARAAASRNGSANDPAA